MKNPLVILCLLTHFTTSSQTTVYVPNQDGTKKTESYIYIDHATGKLVKCMKSSGVTLKDTVPDIAVRVISNQVYLYSYKNGKKSEKTLNIGKKETILNLGYLSSDKKIIKLKDGAPIDEKAASYIRDNRVYTYDHKLIAIIEGQEIFGAALILLNFYYL